MKKGTIMAYRLLGILVNMIAYLVLFSSAAYFFGGGPGGEAAMFFFVGACMVIYSTLSSLFARVVLTLRQPMRYALKDWIKANAYVALICYLLMFFASLVLSAGGAGTEQVLKQHPEAMRGISVATFMGLVHLLLVMSIIVCTHGIWTLILVKRNKAYFQ